MRERKVAMGPGAASLILIMVVLGLSILSVLSLGSAKNDDSLSTRGTERIENVYNGYTQGENDLAVLDEILYECRQNTSDTEDYLTALKQKLPENMTITGDCVTWIEDSDKILIECTVRILPLESGKRYEWVTHRLLVEEETEFE